MDLTCSDLTFPGVGIGVGGQIPAEEAAQGICGVAPTTELDRRIQEALCGPGSSARQVRQDMGGSQVGGAPGQGLVQITPGKVPLLFGLSYVPCPTPRAPTFVLGAGAPVQVPHGSSFVQPQAVGFCCQNCAVGLPCEKG